MWLKEFKIAIIEEDTDKIDSLLSHLPQLTKTDELDQTLTLIEEAKTLLFSLQADTKNNMTKIKKNIDFLRATQAEPINKLDITS